jgi:hypothetical protein
MRYSWWGNVPVFSAILSDLTRQKANVMSRNCCVKEIEINLAVDVLSHHYAD